MRRAACPLALALVAAGCGSGGGKPAPTTSAAPLPSAHATQVQISAPRNDTTLRARFDSSGNVAASTVVSGVADPRTTVLVSSGCRERGCEGVARVDGDGRWQTRLRLVGTPTRLTLPISALYADASDEGSEAEIRVRLRAPAGGDTRRKRAARTRREARALPEVTTPATTPSAAPLRGAGRGMLVMIGDSLAQGTEPLLGGLLPGWTVRTDARRGRPLAEGLRVLAATTASPKSVLAFSLFTNDAPGNVGALESAVRASARRADCVVWATIVRPPVGGRTYDAANARLEELAQGELRGRLVVVPWDQAVADHPEWLAGDGVHATPDGYKARARMYADAARSCAG